MAAAPAARALSLKSRLSFGVGSIAYGIKHNGFSTFLLLYYNQVVGLPATTVGAAILAALSITEELFRERDAAAEVASQMAGLSSELRRWLPPGKRGEGR